MGNTPRTFPCENCGAELRFTPGTRTLGCDYCGHQQVIDGKAPRNNLADLIDELWAKPSDKNVAAQDYVETLRKLGKEAPTTAHVTAQCQSCAAQFDFDANVHSGDCPFCGVAIVTQTHEHRAITPWGVLPFQIEEQHAKAAFKRWLGRLWFAPNKLARFARSDYQFNGMYVPYWDYGCDTHSRYIGQRGDAYQVPVRVRVNINGRWVTQTQMQMRVRWSPVRGNVSRRFDDILVYASHSLSADIAKELAPWDIENIVPYDHQYLSGFQSELYSLPLDEGFSIARFRMESAVQADVRYDIGGDFQRIDGLDTDYSNIGFRHILLPFWTAGFQYRGKTYQFVVNGRTGEVQGERPYSRVKLFFAILAAIIIIGLLLAIIGPHFIAQNGMNDYLPLPDYLPDIIYLPELPRPRGY